MKIFTGIIIIVSAIAILFGRSYDPVPKFYNHSGIVADKVIKVFIDTVNISTATTSIDISPAAFTTVLAATATAVKNTTDPTVTPFALVKSISTTAVSINIYTENSSVVTILGSSVLLGPPMTLSAPASTQVAIFVAGF